MKKMAEEKAKPKVLGKDVVEFVPNQENPSTKNTFRFEEVLRGSKKPKVIGQLYLQKLAFPKIENPEKLRVTVEVLED